MAVAAPQRKTAPAPPPSRTSPPRKKAAPNRGAPGKASPRGRAAAAPAPAPARRAPQRPRPKTRRSGGQLIPIAVGRTAGAVRQLPDSGLVVRMTRGRAWIGVLGVLLVGIVALNVVTLSFAASSGKIDEQITTLEAENSSLGGRVARVFGTDRIRHEAALQGLGMSTSQGPKVIKFSPQDIGTAAQRLAGAG